MLPVPRIEPGRLAWIAIAPVKSMALVQLDRAVVDRTGIAGDRAFAVVDAENRLVNGKRIGILARIRPAYDPGGRLALAFPDGRRVTGDVVRGELTEASFFGRPRPVRPVEGPWSEALTEWAGLPLRLVALDAPGSGPDRGPTTTLLSTAALGSLALAGGDNEPLSPRRFRMTFGIDGVEAHAEDGWLGRDVRVGGALVRVAGNVGRCAVTTHDPDTGRPTFDTLRILGETRGMLPTTEPLPFGVWAEVVEPGEVALGDPVALV
jgi:MOSC domain-containing protein